MELNSYMEHGIKSISSTVSAFYLNNLKGILFRDDDMEHMAFSVVGRWGEKGVTILCISDDKQISVDQRH